ncbi:MAG: serine/threonine-protein kinase, partial [Prosthecobacter sp.]|nr:serine/threonine-protein kinase [Prosthecobacter sp.]
MPDDDPLPPGPTPSSYQRTTGGHFRWQPPTAQRLQELLAGYEVLEMLGAGGMGAVYKARQVSLDRLVAIKILPPEAVDDEMNFVERFRNEARTMARMSHPGIVSVFDFGATSEGQLYIVMEFIDGTDVAKMILAQGKLPPDYALAITAHVCDALAYAH